MVVIKFDLVLLIMFHVSRCERRIVDGHQLKIQKTYAVYLVKATMSLRTYDTWLCGGAIVSARFIITSAACVEDARFLYAIAGYNRYVTDKEINTDRCTRRMKKKIVYTSVPVSYELDSYYKTKREFIDIALAKVESPYHFGDSRYEKICSYKPSIIPVNYQAEHQKAGVTAMVLGWGHLKYWRQHGDHKNYNQEYLQFGTTTLLDQYKCEEEYRNYPNLIKAIKKYMICSSNAGWGRLNELGEQYSENNSTETNSHSTNYEHDQEANKSGVGWDQTRRNIMTLKQTSYNGTDKNVAETKITDQTSIVNRPDIVNRIDVVNRTVITSITDNRRNGICQNDHGGPLVTWVGKQEVLIGVASIFRIADDRKCIGPFLYSSTLDNGPFISCVLDSEHIESLRTSNENKSRRSLLACDSSPYERGFDIIEKHLSWKNHPAGPAENERGGLNFKKKKIWEESDLSEEDLNISKKKKLKYLNVQMVSSKKSVRGIKKPLPLKVEHPQIMASQSEMELLSIMRPPSEAHLPPRIRPRPEVDNLSSTRRSPEMEPSSIISATTDEVLQLIFRASPEREYLSALRSSLEGELPSTLRSSLEGELPSTLRSSLEGELPSTLRSLTEGEHPSTLRSLTEGDHASTLRSSSEEELSSTLRTSTAGPHASILRSSPEEELPFTLRSSTKEEHSSTLRSSLEGEFASTLRSSTEGEHALT